jgi:hypothetical protein
LKERQIAVANLADIALRDLLAQAGEQIRERQRGGGMEDFFSWFRGLALRSSLSRANAVNKGEPADRQEGASRGFGEWS